MLIKKYVCNVCGKENCDGQEYVATVEDPYTGDIKKILTCTSQTRVKKDGNRYYHVVFGHGTEWDVPVEPII